MIAAIAGLIALSLAAPVPAQDETADLQQITVRIPAGMANAQRDARLRAFARAAKGIRSCNQIEAVAHKVEGEIVARQHVSLANMPPQLRVQLAGKLAGTVTQVFGDNGEYRVLIRC